MLGQAIGAALAALSVSLTAVLPRDQSEACARWRDDYPEHVRAVAPPLLGACEPDPADPVAIEDALRRTNLFRWLVGLPPVVLLSELSAQCEAAAVLQRAQRSLDHAPNAAIPCYSEAGAVGSSRANLAAGFATLAAAVNGYMAEETDPTLGHRRWLLYPRFNATGFGLARDGAFGAWSAQWVMSFGPDPGVELVAYPASGPFPIAALLGPWSLSVPEADFARATVTVTDVEDGTVMDIAGAYQPPHGYGWNTLAWEVVAAVAGRPYEVQIDGVRSTSRSSYRYVTTLVDCR